MSKHHKKGNHELSTGNDFINLAERRGAKIGKNHMGFTTIETPAGKVHINPSNSKLDSRTISNLIRWFKLLGLMSLIFVVYLNFAV